MVKIATIAIGLAAGFVSLALALILWSFTLVSRYTGPGKVQNIAPGVRVRLPPHRPHAKVC